MQHLRELREEAGLSQEELAEILHVNRNRIFCWENGKDGKRGVTAYNLQNIAQILHCSTDYLLGLSEYRNYNAWALSHASGLSVAVCNRLSGSGRDLLPLVEALALSDGLPDLKAAIENAIQAGYIADTCPGRKGARLQLSAARWEASRAAENIILQIIETNIADFKARIGE